MTVSRRPLGVVVGLGLLVAISSARLRGDNPTEIAAPTLQKNTPAYSGDAEIEKTLADSKFVRANLVTYQPLEGDLVFALQLRPKLPAQPRRERDYLVLVSTTANMAGAGYIAARQLVEELIKTAGEQDRIALSTVGTPELNKPLTREFVNPGEDMKEELKKALTLLKDQLYPAGDADLKDALVKAIDRFKGEEDGRQRILLYLGDGNSLHDPILGADRAALCRELIKLRVAFYAVPLGINLHPENLHGLSGGTGGTVLRTRIEEENASDALKRFEQAFAAPIVYDAALKLPAAVTEHFPQKLPPLRGDSPTLVVGRTKPAKNLSYTLSAKTDEGKKLELTATEAMPDAEADNYFLLGMAQQWRKAKDQPALLRADRSLALAFEESRLHRQALLASASIALEKLELDAAAQHFERVKLLAPHDVEAEAGLRVVKAVKEGKLTREKIRKQFENAKVDRIGKANGAVQIFKGQVLLAQLDKEAAQAKDPNVGAIAGKDDPLQAHRDRVILEEQKMTQVVDAALRQARRELHANPKGSLDLLTTTLGNVRDNPDISDRLRQALVARLETSLRDIAAQGRVLELRRQEQQKSVSIIQKEIERAQQRKTLEERFEAQFRVFKGLMHVARLEEKTKNDVLDGILAIQEEARFKNAQVPLVTQAAYQQVWASYNIHKREELKRKREAGFMAILLEVEKSHVPMPDEPMIHFPPMAMWKALSKMRKEKYEVRGLPDDEKGRREATEIYNLLQETIDMEDFQQPMTLKEALGLFYEKFAAKNKELPILVDTDAFKEENPDLVENLYDTQIRFPPYPKKMTMGTALRLVLAKIPTNNATYVIRRNFIEITTVERQTREKVLRIYPVGDLVIPISQGSMMMGGGGMMGMGMGMMGMGMGMMGMGGMQMMGMGGMNMMGMGGMGMQMMGMGGMQMMGMGMPMGGMGGMGMNMMGMGGMGMQMMGMGGMGMQMMGMGGMQMMGMGMGGMQMMGMGMQMMGMGMQMMGMGMQMMGMGMSGMGGGFNGQLGMMGASQATDLINLIQTLVAPGEWFPGIQQQQPGQQFLGGMGMVGMFGGMVGMGGGMFGMQGPLPLPQDLGGPVDPTKANTIGFFPPALALMVRAPSRIHTSPIGGLLGGKQKRAELVRLEGMQRGLEVVAGPKDPNLKVAGGQANEKEKEFLAKLDLQRVKNPKFDPTKIWNEALDKGGVPPGLIIATADFLFENGLYRHAAEFLKANLRHGIVVRPWVYEALAIALEASGADPEEVQRAHLSAVALNPNDPEGFLEAARTLAKHKLYDRALAFCKQAAEIQPAGVQAYADALALAEMSKDGNAMAWAAGKLLAQDWPNDNHLLHLKASARLQSLADTLEKDQRKTEADKLRQVLATLRQRDLVIQLTWEKGSEPAQLELEVKEPCGSVCSLKQTQTPGGGTLLTNNLLELTKSTYTAAEAFTGDYQITVRRSWGQPLGGRARLEIIRNLGTPQEQRRLEIVRLDQAKTITFKLESGRRKELASVAPPALQQTTETNQDDAPQPAVPGGILAKLRAFAYSDFTGAKGVGGGVGTPGAWHGGKSTSPAPAGETAQRTQYESPVVPIVGGGMSMTAKMRLAADRQQLEMVLRPIYQTMDGTRPPAPSLSTIPGAP